MTHTQSAAIVLRPAQVDGAFPLALPSLGNLDAYISAVNRLPMLSAEEEARLART